MSSAACAPRKPNVTSTERLVCLAAGAALCGFAVARRGPLQIISGLLGAALVYRGLSAASALQYGSAEEDETLPRENREEPAPSGPTIH